MGAISLSSNFFHQNKLEVWRLRRVGRIIARNRLLLKALPTAGGYAFGDCLTQQLGPLWPAERWPSKHNPSAHDFSKTALMAGVGAGLGAPASLALYAWMNCVAPGSGHVLAAAKFAVDQLVGCVLWQAAYMVISEPYRQTFLAFAATQRQQWQQQQQQRQQQQQSFCAAAAAAALAAPGGSGGAAVVAAC